MKHIISTNKKTLFVVFDDDIWILSVIPARLSHRKFCKQIMLAFLVSILSEQIANTCDCQHLTFDEKKLVTSATMQKIWHIHAQLIYTLDMIKKYFNYLYWQWLTLCSVSQLARFMKSCRFSRVRWLSFRAGLDWPREETMLPIT